MSSKEKDFLPTQYQAYDLTTDIVVPTNYKSNQAHDLIVGSATNKLRCLFGVLPKSLQTARDETRPPCFTYMTAI